MPSNLWEGLGHFADGRGTSELSDEIGNQQTSVLERGPRYCLAVSRGCYPKHNTDIRLCVPDTLSTPSKEDRENTSQREGARSNRRRVYSSGSSLLCVILYTSGLTLLYRGLLHHLDGEASYMLSLHTRITPPGSRHCSSSSPSGYSPELERKR